MVMQSGGFTQCHLLIVIHTLTALKANLYGPLLKSSLFLVRYMLIRIRIRKQIQVPTEYDADPGGRIFTGPAPSGGIFVDFAISPLSPGEVLRRRRKRTPADGPAADQRAMAAGWGGQTRMVAGRGGQRSEDVPTSWWRTSRWEYSPQKNNRKMYYQIYIKYIYIYTQLHIDVSI